MSDAAPVPPADPPQPAATEEKPPPRPPIAAAPISVILLSEDESPPADEILDSWRSYLGGLQREYDIVVSGCSTGSLGDALRSGLQAAHHPLVFYTTADECYQPSDLALLLKWIDKVDLVTGYRVSASPSTWKDRCYRSIIRWIFGVRVRDLGCLFLLARRSIFARIPIQSHSILAHAEVLAKANFLGCLMTEVPVSHRRSAFFRRANWGQVYAEARRLFARPDFGPPLVPTETKS